MDNKLQHHGIEGQKWGIRRYQNEDGTLTPEGKARLANYKENEVKRTTKYYSKNRHSGMYGLHTTYGLNSLNRQKNKLNNKLEKAKQSANSEKVSKYTNDLKINESMQKAQKAMLKGELKKVMNMSYENMMTEKHEVGKQMTKDLLISIAVTSVIFPTSGMVYTTGTNPQSIKANLRSKNWKTNNK